MYYNTGGSYGTLSDPTTGRALNKWYHVVVASNATTLSLFVDGTRVATVTAGISKPTTRTTVRVGNDLGGTGMTGYLSNVRFVSGANAYDASQSSITVPTTALTAVSGTQLLTCQSNRFIDNSSNAFALTVNGTPSVQAFSPFAPTAAYSAATNGGSGYFDGSGDYLVEGTSTTDFNLSTGDWAIDFWVYKTSAADGSIVNLYNTAGNTSGLSIWVGSNGAVHVDNGVTGAINAGNTGINTWAHFIVTGKQIGRAHV